MIKINNNLPPQNRRLFLFILLSIIHLVLLLYIYFEIKYIILILFEALFFLYFNKFDFKIILKIFIISIIIFLLNIFFSEGKIIFKSDLLKVTEEGLVNGLKKAGVLMSTFFFTINILKDNKQSLLIYLQNNKNNNIFLNSINYFLIFWEELGENNNIKILLSKIIIIYKNDKLKINYKKSEENIIKKNIFIYHGVILVIFTLIYFFL